ncbi:RICIN domain-containing protein [Opitutales bacterium ASA1]|uniref:glycoside hydrolase family 2 protein n=1 Tax=Congregicoccus parvus TaxID=3081749 RepID=UPI002B3035AF|nr:RICIN domain-containing protein [Opitutales bacterium ASA1]
MRFCAVFALAVVTFMSAHARRAVIDFNPDWRFLKADPAGAQAPDFDDAAWEDVSAPHTFNDVDTFDDWSLPGHRGEQAQWSGRTWYRKHFDAPAAWRGRKVFIEFEGVRQIAEVYLNGQLLGVAKGGFTPFGLELTRHLRIGATNVLAVMVDNRFQRDPMDPSLAPQAATDARTHPNLAQLSQQLMEQIPDTLEELQADQIPWNNPHWHPAHGGIYRNVKLVVTDPLHVTLPLYSFLQTAGPYVYAQDISEASARVFIEVPLRNGRAEGAEVEISAAVVDASGRTVGEVAGTRAIAAGADGQLTLELPVERPHLWEPAYPHLYRARLTIGVAGTAIDDVEIPFGIRAIHWTADGGLFLNGSHLKLRGWGQKSTNEWPGLGAAMPDWMHFHTSWLMREAGGNFIRWGHTAGGPAHIVASDRLGLITAQPGTDGEHDTRGGAWKLRAMNFRDVIVYFRNNPSIFIWEGGNQKISREHAAELRSLMDTYDPHGYRAYAHRRADAITAEFMDVGIGTEGGREIAQLPVVEGEYNREESPRRVWDDHSPPNFGYPEAKGQTYQLTSEQFAVNQVGHYVKKLGAADHAGGANWIFSDSTSGGRVAVEVARTSGEVDGVRLPKEAYYVTQVMFRDEPSVHVIGHWSYPAGTTKDVFVVANADEVELSVNGRPLGRATPRDRFLFTFPAVAFEPGEIRAVAYRGGEVVATTRKETAGPARALRLTPIVGPTGWIADGADVVLFDVEAVDAQGRRAPTFQQRVDFELSGAGVWRGGYNSGRIDSINHTWLELEAGINRIAVRSTRTPGEITLSVRGAGLESATTRIQSRAYTGALPVVPAVALGEPPARRVTEPVRSGVSARAAIMLGRFIRTFNYTGPEAAIVHVDTDAQPGKNAYVDIDSPLQRLPENLRGADWIKIANRDANYHAVDLVELAVGAAPAVIAIAHDPSLEVPPWLKNNYTPTGAVVEVRGRPLHVYERAVEAQASVTLGPNTEQARVDDAMMYLVFVRAP